MQFHFFRSNQKSQEDNSILIKKQIEALQKEQRLLIKRLNYYQKKYLLPEQLKQKNNKPNPQEPSKAEQIKKWEELKKYYKERYGDKVVFVSIPYNPDSLVNLSVKLSFLQDDIYRLHTEITAIRHAHEKETIITINRGGIHIRRILKSVLDEENAIRHS